MKNTALLTIVLVTFFSTSSVFGQNTKKDATSAARDLANQLTAQAIKVQVAATETRRVAKKKLESATAALTAAKAHVEALATTRTAIAEANTEAEEALETWQKAADELATAVANPATLGGIVSGLETDDRISRELKVSTETTLKNLIAKAHRDFKKLAGTAYDPASATPAQVDTALAGFLVSAGDVLTEKTGKSDTAQAAFDEAVAALRVANEDFIAAGGLQSRYKALSVKSPSQAALPAEVVEAVTKIATQLERSAAAAEATTTATRQNALATAIVAAAMNSQTARTLTKEQVLQAEAYDVSRSVLGELSKVNPKASARFSHLTGIVVLKNPVLEKKVELLKGIEQRLKQGASPKQLKVIIQLLERIAPVKKN